MRAGVILVGQRVFTQYIEPRNKLFGVSVCLLHHDQVKDQGRIQCQNSGRKYFRKCLVHSKFYKLILLILDLREMNQFDHV